MDSRFEWFSTWVDQNLLLTFTAVSVPDAGHVLAVCAPTGFDRGPLSLREARDISEPTVRLGTRDGWTYAVEHASTVGGDPAFLERLTSDGSLAVALCFTATISTVHIARDGKYLCGFEAADPGFVRWGSTAHAFDQQIEEAGLMDRGAQRPGAACASFLQLMTGLVLTQATLEDSLPCATLPA